MTCWCGRHDAGQRRARRGKERGRTFAEIFHRILCPARGAADNRGAGAFLGLRPRQSQSGDSDPQHRITKTGNIYLRRLLGQAAHYILGRFGPDSAPRRWGLKLTASGGQRGKKRALVAVARKLAVILHCMWRSGQSYQAFPERAAAAATA